MKHQHRILITVWGLILLVSCSHTQGLTNQKENFCEARQYYGDLLYDFRIAGADKKLLGKLKFEKIEDSTIKFTGMIESGDHVALEEMLKDKPTRLVVKSAGGDSQEALEMALLLRDSSVKEIVVDRFCLATCAAYLFVAIENKIIRDGIVGIHGNTTAQINNPMLTIRKSDAETNEEKLEWIAANKDKILKEEGDFLSSIGVSQALFDLAQMPDKGRGDNQFYSLLLPGPKTFAQHNVRNVKGFQNACLGQWIGMNNVLSP